jgi:serine/threonine protein kinase
MVCYRDLKPSNVGFDYQDNAKLFDFGFAHDLDERTVGVISKNDIMGETTDSPSVEVYNFSLLLCELLALARAPFQGKFGWHQDPNKRPYFALIVHELERICR